MGPNGSGKTTLASIVAAVRTADKGVIEVYGKKPSQVKSFLGYVPQENFSSPKLTGKENLLYFASLLGYSSKEAERLVSELLENIGLVEEADKRVDKYSGGMRKRLEIATAVFPGIKVLVLDEPTTGLDPTARRTFFNMIRNIMNRNTSIILITHIGSDAELAHRVGLIDRGKIIAEGTPDELKRQHAVEDVITVDTAVRNDEVLTMLKKFSLGERITESQDGYKIFSRDGDRIIADLVRTLDKSGFRVMRIEMARPTLEDVFFRLTERNIHEEATA
jgi:ABC-type multidrug transport system ATPase subunit